MSRLFGTDGVRGIVGEELSPELAMRIGRAVACVLAKGATEPRVVIGQDTRLSSGMLVNALSAGLCSAGAEVTLLGVIPTPAVAFLTRRLRADAGIVVSASHNSFEYNGIKIFDSEGFKLADELEEKIEALVLGNGEGMACASSEKIGVCVAKEDSVSEYISYLRSACGERLDGLKIAIDCANGASSVCAYELFSSLGAKCHMLGCEPNGKNINDRCGSVHLDSLIECVKGGDFDAGLSFDGDADRFLCIDEHGGVLDGDMIMATLALDMKKRGALVKNTVVGTVMTNFGFEAFCKENDISFIPARVGDRYVLEEMLVGGYNFGGEQSGHIIFGDYSTTGDGELSALMLLSLMKRKKQPLSRLCSVMKRYPQVIMNIPATPEAKLRLLTDHEIKELIAKERALLGTRGRLLARASGTEALIRIMVESESEDEAYRVAEAVATGLRNIIEKGEGECL